MLTKEQFNLYSFDKRCEIIGLFAIFKRMFQHYPEENFKYTLFYHYGCNIIVKDKILESGLFQYEDSFAIEEGEIYKYLPNPRFEI